MKIALSDLKTQEAYQAEAYFDLRHRIPNEYATVRVSMTDLNRWYAMLEGEEVFCIVYRNRDGRVVEFHPVEFHGRMVKVARGLHPDDCSIC